SIVSTPAGTGQRPRGPAHSIFPSRSTTTASRTGRAPPPGAHGPPRREGRWPRPGRGGEGGRDRDAPAIRGADEEPLGEPARFVVAEAHAVAVGAVDEPVLHR